MRLATWSATLFCCALAADPKAGLNHSHHHESHDLQHLAVHPHAEKVAHEGQPRHGDTATLMNISYAMRHTQS